MESQRFSDEGCSTILQLAYADPIELTIRTGFGFSYVVDCCSQALGWLSFGDRMRDMAKFGLRGSQDMRQLMLEVGRKTKEPRAVLDKNERLAKKTLGCVASELKMDAESLERAFLAIAWDPNGVFLYQVWHPEWN